MINLPTDFSDLTPDALRALAQSATNDVMQTNQCDYVKAWATAKKIYPALFAAMEVASSQARSAAMANDDGVLASGKPAIASQQNIDAFGLQNPSQDEFDVAWKANGQQAAPVASDKIFGALQDYFMRKSNLTPADAAAYIATKHPMLNSANNTAIAAKKMQENLPAPGAGFTPAKPAATPENNLFRQGMELSNPFKPV